MSDHPDNEHWYTSPTAIEAARVGINFVPGGKVVQTGARVVDTSLAFVQGNTQAAAASSAEFKKLSETFGDDFERDARYSRGLKKTVQKIKNHYKGRGWAAVISALGAAAGMAIGTLLFPGVGTIAGLFIGGIGGIVGGFVTDKIIDLVFPPARTTDATEIASQIYAAQLGNQKVAAEEVFVAMAGNLRDKDLKRIRADVYKLTGKRTLEEALAAGETVALRALMQRYDNTLRAEAGTLTDPLNPTLTVSEQYAAAINSGQVDARALMFRDGRLPVDLPAADAGPAMADYLPAPNIPGQGRGPRGRG